MFGISFAELLTVLLIGLVVVGPKRLVEIAYQMGKYWNKIKAELKHIKEIQLGGLDDSVLYDSKIELNKSLDKLKSEFKSQDLNSPLPAKEKTK